MKRTPITIDITAFPAPFHLFLKNAALYDSSCSPEARVIFIDKDDGYFLKSAPRGTLQKEVDMTRYFHTLGLAPAVLDYRSDERDWLLTERARGEDATHAIYLEDPRRLAATMGELLRRLHDTPFHDCPVKNHTAAYLAFAESRYRKGCFDTSLFAEQQHLRSPEDAITVVKTRGHILKSDTLLHGDYCLPNILFDNWRFSSFIDLGNGGVGDRHVDLFWGAWTLRFNLGTDAYRHCFFDAYGRERIDPEAMLVVEAAELFG